MKITLLAILLSAAAWAQGLFPFPGPGLPVSGGGGTPALITSNRISTSGSSTGTSSATNCTGATSLAIFVCGYNSSSIAFNVIDSQGNTYTKTGDSVSSGGTAWHGSIWVKAAPSSIGLGSITWTTTANSYTSIDAACFSGTSGTIDKSSGHGQNDALSTVQPGSITPAAGSLVFTGVTWQTGDTDATTPIDSSFTLIQHTQQGANGVASAIAYKVQTGAVNPTWKLDNSTSERTAVQVSINHN